ncbi:hypothetical protein DIPPA_35433 [Diplonema papillatum]|nr:hypothetical protein DIPPA_35433 [Diplonema papillatum]
MRLAGYLKPDGACPVAEFLSESRHQVLHGTTVHVVYRAAPPPATHSPGRGLQQLLSAAPPAQEAGAAAPPALQPLPRQLPRGLAALGAAVDGGDVSGVFLQKGMRVGPDAVRFASQPSPKRGRPRTSGLATLLLAATTKQAGRHWVPTTAAACHHPVLICNLPSPRRAQAKPACYHRPESLHWKTLRHGRLEGPLHPRADASQAAANTTTSGGPLVLETGSANDNVSPPADECKRTEVPQAARPTTGAATKLTRLPLVLETSGTNDNLPPPADECRKGAEEAQTARPKTKYSRLPLLLETGSANDNLPPPADECRRGAEEAQTARPTTKYSRLPLLLETGSANDNVHPPRTDAPGPSSRRAEAPVAGGFAPACDQRAAAALRRPGRTLAAAFGRLWALEARAQGAAAGRRAEGQVPALAGVVRAVFAYCPQLPVLGRLGRVSREWRAAALLVAREPGTFAAVEALRGALANDAADAAAAVLRCRAGRPPFTPPACAGGVCGGRLSAEQAFEQRHPARLSGSGEVNQAFEQRYSGARLSGSREVNQAFEQRYSGARLSGSGEVLEQRHSVRLSGRREVTQAFEQRRAGARLSGSGEVNQAFAQRRSARLSGRREVNQAVEQRHSGARLSFHLAFEQCHTVRLSGSRDLGARPSFVRTSGKSSADRRPRARLSCTGAATRAEPFHRVCFSRQRHSAARPSLPNGARPLRTPAHGSSTRPSKDPGLAAAAAAAAAAEFAFDGKTGCCDSGGAASAHGSSVCPLKDPRLAAAAELAFDDKADGSALAHCSSARPPTDPRLTTAAELAFDGKAGDGYGDGSASAHCSRTRPPKDPRLTTAAELAFDDKAEDGYGDGSASAHCSRTRPPKDPRLTTAAELAFDGKAGDGYGDGSASAHCGSTRPPKDLPLAAAAAELASDDKPGGRVSGGSFGPPPPPPPPGVPPCPTAAARLAYSQPVGPVPDSRVLRLSGGSSRGRRRSSRHRSVTVPAHAAAARTGGSRRLGDGVKRSASTASARGRYSPSTVEDLEKMILRRGVRAPARGVWYTCRGRCYHSPSLDVSVSGSHPGDACVARFADCLSSLRSQQLAWLALLRAVDSVCVRHRTVIASLQTAAA